MNGKLTDVLFCAAGVQDPVRLQCANGIEVFFDKSVHDTAACISAVAKEIMCTKKKHIQKWTRKLVKEIFGGSLYGFVTVNTMGVNQCH